MVSASAFSLLGPYAPWMDQLKGYRRAGDIGGPMNIGEEYRWNVPVITYGFDQAFVDAFGQSGIDAVEQAIQVFNELPPASEVDLINYPTVALADNPVAASLNVRDLKSVTMHLVSEHLGLADPARFLFTLRDIQITNQTTNFTVIQRSFDPDTLEPSPYLNDALYIFDGFQHFTNPEIYQPKLIQVSLQPNAGSVASGIWQPGKYFTGMTRDDVGGLKYLYHPQNYNVEPLLPGVVGTGTNTDNFVTTALRPGVDKLTFVRQQLDTNLATFIPFTNDFIDTYFTNNEPRQQTLRRVTTSPDFLFSAKDFGVTVDSGTYQSAPGEYIKYREYWVRGLEGPNSLDWINNSILNNDGSNGPGLIQPGIKITFADNRRYYLIADRQYLPFRETVGDVQVWFDVFNWASFDSSPNIVLPQPPPTNVTHLTLESRMTETNTFLWAILVNPNAGYDIQFSTNLTQWETVQSFFSADRIHGIHTFITTNLGANVFYRAVRRGFDWNTDNLAGEEIE